MTDDAGEPVERDHDVVARDDRGGGVGGADRANPLAVGRCEAHDLGNFLLRAGFNPAVRGNGEAAGPIDDVVIELLRDVPNGGGERRPGHEPVILVGAPWSIGDVLVVGVDWRDNHRGGRQRRSPPGTASPVSAYSRLSTERSPSAVVMSTSPSHVNCCVLLLSSPASLKLPPGEFTVISVPISVSSRINVWSSRTSNSPRSVPSITVSTVIPFWVASRVHLS